MPYIPYYNIPLYHINTTYHLRHFVPQIHNYDLNKVKTPLKKDHDIDSHKNVYTLLQVNTQTFILRRRVDSKFLI